jgi:acetoin utilization deacetylase AcuC-like enzyme
MSEETKVSNEAVVDSGTEDVTQEVAQNEYIAESKKYRKRAQEAESQLAKLQKTIAAQEEEKLKQKEDFKTLYEKVASENANLTQDAERWKSYESNKRAALLDRHPEDERESLSRLDLETLEYVTNKISKPTNPEVVGRAKVSAQASNKAWKDMNDDERRAFYDMKAKKG